MPSRPRNNIMRLSAGIRQKICELLDDGATYDEIRMDPEILEEIKDRGVSIHNSSFAAYREGAEFDEFVKVRRKYAEKMERNHIAALILEGGNGPDSIAKLANYELLRICLEKLQGGEELTEKEMRAISGAVAAYERNRISEDKEDEKRKSAEREAKYQAQIAQLSAAVETMKEKLAKLPQDNSNVIAEMDKFVKGD